MCLYCLCSNGFKYFIASIFFFLILGVSFNSFGQVSSDSISSLSIVYIDSDEDGVPDYLDQKIRISGRVNVSSGLLNKDYLQTYIQNDSVGVSISGDEVNTPFQPGDSLIVNGRVQEVMGLLDVVVDSYQVVPNDSKQIEPKPLREVVENPEAYVGMLVKGQGKIVEKGLTYHGKYVKIALSEGTASEVMVYVSNFHTLHDQFDFGILSIGDRIKVTGIIGEYNPDFPAEQTYKLFLRSPDDLKYSDIPRNYLFLFLGGLILISVLIAVWIIILRKRVSSKTAELQQSLGEKEVLLREIHHRVKNSLAIVSGLIGIQLESTDSSEAQSVLQDSQSRIQSVGLIHEKLYQTESLSDIRLDNYLKDLVQAIHSTFTEYSEAVDLRFDLQPVEVNVDKVIPCGLLMNELVVNAFKHAFKKGQQGILKVTLHKHKSNIILTIADNGPGVSEDFNLDGSDSLGSMLISTFAAQLEAQTEIESGKDGTAFTFTFSKN